jgi:hypothetical protein
MSNSFYPQTQLDLHWKPYFFLYQRAIHIATVKKKPLSSRILDWESLEESVRKLAIQHSRTYSEFEDVRENTKIVGTKLVAPYVATLANLTCLEKSEACLLASSIHYCLFRWCEHSLHRPSSRFQLFSGKQANAKSKEGVKVDYIRSLASNLSNCNSAHETTQLLCDPKLLNRWQYIESLTDYEEGSNIRTFRERCNSETGSARMIIAGGVGF